MGVDNVAVGISNNARLIAVRWRAARLAPGWWTRRLLAAHAQRHPPDRHRLDLVAHLTEREAEVLHALARGLSNVEIAATIWVSQETVKTHIKSILNKLEVRDRTQAVVWAYRTDFVAMP
jgi:DNA-binding NarL/FixJ family response regulator